MGAPPVQVSGLEFRYARGDFQLRVPELRVAPRESLALIGASGCGKTTLLHLIAGIEVPRAGRIDTCGVDVGRLDDAARRAFRIQRVGLVFQEFELLDYLSVLDNVLLPYRIHPALRLGPDVRRAAVELAESVGIGGALGRRPGELSQGERQRVAVCRALVTSPELLLADEPTGNLDPANKGLVLDCLFDAARRVGSTLVVVTHDHALLDRFDRVADFGALTGRDSGSVDPTAEDAR